MTKLPIEKVLILERCAEIEELCAELYRFYEEFFAADRQLAELWHEAAQEEENHSLQFKMAIRIREGLIGSVNLNQWQVDNTAKVIRSILEGVKKSPPTPADALRSAVKIEENLAQFHVDCAVDFAEESYRQLFQAMMAADNNHLERFKRAAERLSGVSGE